MSRPSPVHSRIWIPTVPGVPRFDSPFLFCLLFGYLLLLFLLLLLVLLLLINLTHCFTDNVVPCSSLSQCLTRQVTINIAKDRTVLSGSADPSLVMNFCLRLYQRSWRFPIPIAFSLVLLVFKRSVTFAESPPKTKIFIISRFHYSPGYKALERAYFFISKLS